MLPAEQAGPLKLLEKGVSKEALAGLVSCIHCPFCKHDQEMAHTQAACLADCSASNMVLVLQKIARHAST